MGVPMDDGVVPPTNSTTLGGILSQHQNNQPRQSQCNRSWREYTPSTIHQPPHQQCRHSSHHQSQEQRFSFYHIPKEHIRYRNFWPTTITNHPQGFLEYPAIPLNLQVNNAHHAPNHDEHHKIAYQQALANLHYQFGVPYQLADTPQQLQFHQ